MYSYMKLGAYHHASTLTCVANLAFTWETQGQDADALAPMERCVLARPWFKALGHYICGRVALVAGSAGLL